MKTSHPRISFASRRPSFASDASLVFLQTSLQRYRGRRRPPAIGRTHMKSSVGTPQIMHICMLSLLSSPERTKTLRVTEGFCLDILGKLCRQNASARESRHYHHHACEIPMHGATVANKNTASTVSTNAPNNSSSKKETGRTADRKSTRLNSSH